MSEPGDLPHSAPNYTASKLGFLDLCFYDKLKPLQFWFDLLIFKLAATSRPNAESKTQVNVRWYDK
jgi:hypothetical protein